jgi:hypothetical protein
MLPYMFHLYYQVFLMKLKDLRDSKTNYENLKQNNTMKFTLIKTSGCSKPASRVSIRK